MLCILSVFIPAFILNEPVKSLFMPLTLAVGFAMIASYLLSSTLVPVLTVWLVKHGAHDEHKVSLFDRFLNVFVKIVMATVRHRWIVVGTYLAACGVLIVLVWSVTSTELFPEVDSGQFVLRFRAPPGTEYDLTRRCAVRILDVINEESGGNVEMSIGYTGMGSTNTATNNILLFMRASDDGVLRVRLKEGSGVAVADLRDRLRKVLPEKVEPWLQDYLSKHGLSAEEAEARSKQMSFGFEPGDIVSTVMSFGSPNPVEVLVIGPKREEVKVHALKVLAEMKKIPELRDVQLYQQLEYPTIKVDIDRQMAGLSGVNVKDITEATLVGNSSSRYVIRNYWRDPKTGVDYQVQIQVPTQRMDRPEEVENLPIRRVNSDSTLLLRDVATVRPGTTAGEIDRIAMHRYLSITANFQGNDLGGAARDIKRAIAAAGEPPRGVQVSVRGQVRADGGDVHFLDDRSCTFGRGDPGALDGLLSVVPRGAGFAGRRAGRRARRADDAAADGDQPEHRVVHGLDHVHRRLGFQLGAAVRPSWTTIGRPGHW